MKDKIYRIKKICKQDNNICTLYIQCREFSTHQLQRRIKRNREKEKINYKRINKLAVKFSTATEDQHNKNNILKVLKGK